ncbi:hypothetical protein MA16_Dca010542 [Dendrobium catenatum]|uniref:Uncharacterized protein n=1 Tax=Dendrobium catenatum TaxID=906689 RepID=A0A2I0XF11_9ASPA|nr:hypothetical protein MA16_Dca010542 [Dendrobium catenatum]
MYTLNNEKHVKHLVPKLQERAIAPPPALLSSDSKPVDFPVRPGLGKPVSQCYFSRALPGIQPALPTTMAATPHCKSNFLVVASMRSARLFLP